MEGLSAKHYNPTMSHKAKKFFIISILLILIQFSYDPISFLSHTLESNLIKAQYTKATTKWESVAIQNYNFEIRGDSESICIVNAQIEVRNGAVKKAQPLDSSSPLPSNQWAEPDWGNEIFLCDYYHFTVPHMFAMLDTILQTSPLSILAVEFDSQYGFINKFEDGIFANNGWFSFRAMRVYNKFQIINFEPAY